MPGRIGNEKPVEHFNPALEDQCEDFTRILSSVMNAFLARKEKVWNLKLMSLSCLTLNASGL